MNEKKRILLTGVSLSSGNKVPKNINTVVNSGLCLQCGACYSICPVDAIKISSDIDSRPVVNNECTNCRKCLRVCPGLNPLQIDDGDPILGPIERCYLGYSSNSEIRFKSSSGGIISSLNIYLLQNNIVDGVICLRQSRESIYKNEVILATSADEVLSALGSRYAPAFVCSGLKDLPLKDNGYYAIVGKPCDIQATIKYSKITKTRDFLKIAIFCAHTPAMSGTKEILTSSNVNLNDVSNISYRGEGWPGFFIALSKDGDVLLKRKYNDVWGSILCKRQYRNKRCFLCHDCTGEYADISIGDAWLKQFIGNSDGHSVVITRSETGDILMRDCIVNNILTIESVSSDIVIESQQSLLQKKQNIFLKRIIARLFNEKITNEKVIFERKKNNIKDIPGIAKYLLFKKLSY